MVKRDPKSPPFPVPVWRQQQKHNNDYRIGRSFVRSLNVVTHSKSLHLMNIEYINKAKDPSNYTNKKTQQKLRCFLLLTFLFYFLVNDEE